MPTFCTDQKFHIREIGIERFSISLNIHSESASIETETTPMKSTVKFGREMQLSPQNFKNTKAVHFNKPDPDDEYRKLRSSDCYLLFPLDISLKMIKAQDLTSNFKESARLTIKVDIKEALIFVINNDHIQYLKTLTDSLKVMEIVQKNIHLRPNQRLQNRKANAIAWWQYAIKCVLEERKKVDNLFKSSATKLYQTRKYIDLYKRKQEIVI